MIEQPPPPPPPLPRFICQICRGFSVKPLMIASTIRYLEIAQAATVPLNFHFIKQ